MERKLTITLLRSLCSGDREAPALLREVPPGAWGDILRQLEVMDLAPLFFSRLMRASAAHLIPQKIAKSLGNAYFLHAARNLVIFEDLESLLRRFTQTGIDAIVLKGACLAETVYDDMALRPMNDIDFLVRECDLKAAQETLIGMGYGPSMRPPIADQLRLHHHLIPFTRPARPSVEVHWTLSPLARLSVMDMDGFRERAVRAGFGGTTALILSPEDLLLHLCLHFSANHRFSILQMKNLCDIAETIKRYRTSIDWKALNDRARGYGVGKYIYCTLRVAAKLFGAEVRPEDIEQIDHEDADMVMADMVAEHLMEEDPVPLPDVLELMDREVSLGRKLKVLARCIVPSRGSLSRKYEWTAAAGKAWPYLYMRHWLDGLSRLWKILGQLLSSRKGARDIIRRRREAMCITNWLRSGSARRVM